MPRRPAHPDTTPPGASRTKAVCWRAFKSPALVALGERVTVPDLINLGGISTKLKMTLKWRKMT